MRFLLKQPVTSFRSLTKELFFRLVYVVTARSASPKGMGAQGSEVQQAPRHSALVRVTHWIHVASFIALVLSGFAILLA